MKLTLGFSPCPNDTFIFDAMVNGLIDCGDLEFDIRLEDVQTLNQMALAGELDVSKISYGVLPLVMDNYQLLNSGSALGTGVGPLLIANSMLTPDQLAEATVAIPGEHTTAHLLFNHAFPRYTNKVFKRYDEIESFVLSGGDKVAGVIIHENRFTYKQKGLKKIIDLGDHWEQTTGKPIPLGGIVARKTLPAGVIHKVDALIRKSVQYSFDRYPELSDFIRNNAQEMSEEVMRKHIDLYVNDYTVALGVDGRNAVEYLLKYSGMAPNLSHLFAD
jgi:1,4-dihydroxy-6-naphthoate synthase